MPAIRLFSLQMGEAAKLASISSIISDGDTVAKTAGLLLDLDLIISVDTSVVHVAGAMGKPVWVRFTLVPGRTDAPENVEGLARFIAPMKNVQWVEVQPFHQLGAFKWKAIGLEYPEAQTQSPTPELMARVLGQFRDAGCTVR